MAAAKHAGWRRSQTTPEDKRTSGRRTARDAMDPGGLQRFRQARRRQEGGEAPRQP